MSFFVLAAFPIILDKHPAIPIYLDNTVYINTDINIHINIGTCTILTDTAQTPGL